MFGSDDTPETRLRRKFWKAIDDSPFMMLGLKGVDDDQTRPMTAQVDRRAIGDMDGRDDGAGTIYFFGSKSDGVGRQVSGTARAVATYAARDHGLFAHVHGELVEATDPAVIERLWNPFIAAWYKDGKTDPDLRLMRFDTEKAEIWEADKGATFKAVALKALFNVDPGKQHSTDHKAEIQL